jgi:hypothetical protein
MSVLEQRVKTLLTNGFLEEAEFKSIIEDNFTLLETNIEVATHNLLKNQILKEIFAIYMGSKLPRDKILEMDIYESVTSKSMLRLITDYKDVFDGLGLKELLISALSSKLDNKYRVCILIYQTIYEYINSIFEPIEKRENTSIVVKSSKNSERTEFIEDLGISNYEQILENFDSFKVYPKTSSSPTIIISADLKTASSKRSNYTRALTILNKPKLFFKIYINIFDFLNIEKKIYEELFKLVQYNITPNILCKIGISNDLSNFYRCFERISPEFKAGLDSTIRDVNRDIDEKSEGRYTPDWSITNLTITQKGDMSLFDILETLTPEQVKEVLFQLLYTLYVFEKIEFSHGDLHLGNIMINRLTEPVDLYYKISGQMFKVSTLLIVKIYDFDHSTIFKSTNIRVNSRNITIHEQKNGQKMLGITNRFNKNLDKLKLLLPLFDTPLIKDMLSEFIRQVFPGLSSEETVLQTYERLLAEENHLIEANKLYGTELAEGVTTESIQKSYGIRHYILNYSWKKYFEVISNRYGQYWIVKNGLLDDFSDDHLWIPDEIISSYDFMLATPLFTEFQNAEPINVRQHPIYTIDGRL